MAKQTFNANTFASKTFACGTFRGAGVTPVVSAPPITRDLTDFVFTQRDKTDFPYVRRDLTNFVSAQRDKTDFE